MRYYKLQPNREVVEVTKKEWIQWRNQTFGIPICSIGRTPVGNTIVSTVFLGICENDDVKPFETMVYNGALPTVTYNTWEEAEQGHKTRVDEMTKLIS